MERERLEELKRQNAKLLEENQYLHRELELAQTEGRVLDAIRNWIALRESWPQYEHVDAGDPAEDLR